MTDPQDYYAVLGVPRDADEAEIKQAYRELARVHHPDQSTEPDAQERFEEVAEAYAVLSDPSRRADYDRSDRDQSGAAESGAGSGTGWFGRLFGEPGWRADTGGEDLWHEQEISVPDAVLGTTVDVPGLDGDLPLTVPPGTQPGTVLRIPGQGLPAPDGRGRGDLAVRVSVHVAEHLQVRERRLYQRLRAAEADAVFDPPPGGHTTDHE